MKKKEQIIELNNQKGITGADIVLSLLMIITALTVISMTYANLIIGSRETDRKSGATRIATNILENMSQMYYDEIAQALTDLVNQGIADIQENVYKIAGGNNQKAFSTSIPNGYNVDINFENDYGEASDGADIVKKVTIDVKYTVNDLEKKVTLNKTFQREPLRECNSPNFSKEYVEQMVGQNTNYELYTSTSEYAAGAKIICPIKYNREEKKYEIISDTKQPWYSYSNKQWARVLVLNPEDLNQDITNLLLRGENSYVWIPRFGLENGSLEYESLYFKYKSTDLAILNSYEQENANFIYYYISKNIEWKTNNSIPDDELFGKWCKYSDLKNSTTKPIAYILNNSKYGPMLEY